MDTLSVAVASKLTTGSSYSIFWGHVNFGASMSGYRFTLKVHYKFNPSAFVAETLTIVCPTMKEDPDSGAETTVSLGGAIILILTT